MLYISVYVCLFKKEKENLGSAEAVFFVFRVWSSRREVFVWLCSSIYCTVERVTLGFPGIGYEFANRNGEVESDTRCGRVGRYVRMYTSMAICQIKLEYS